ncbi:hypothetical protein [Clostridium sp.]|uniref:hypothetical protein n=1 Tax=Clostridium TaxID=1485 RepID=UPI002904CA15|nr:hypothetical protein [Clostridium sp.]MDU1825432.1 hypothetical protein [Clostridium sp.]MDU1843354.1 hypothetical protein [Clostridium sp.]MDU2692203.1 hypothetical protein [Clostridium sp.]MDU2958453.1 hypothetical protein [Clostridium sp.]MDU3109234.1 hypothetical protein [Clostridium sp.]
MSYKLEVRTDVIDPHTYLEAELNYKELLQAINDSGGYVLFQQIYKWFGGKSKGFREIKKLQDLLLLGSEQLNNNKYVYLKTVALKYLKYKDFEGEVTELKINRLLNKPGFRPIMNSVYSFEYMMLENKYINTNSSLQTLDIFIYNAREVFKNDRISNLHLGRIIKDEYVEQLKTKLKILGDRNAIFLKNYEPSNEFAKSNLEFVWFDFNQETDKNPVLRVLRLISKFLNNVGTTGKNNLLNCCNFSLEIVTLSEDRSTTLKGISDRAIGIIEKKNSQYLNSNTKTKENLVVSNIKHIEYKVFSDVEGYIKISAKGESEFNFVNETVINRLQALKEHLKGGD